MEGVSSCPVAAESFPWHPGATLPTAAGITAPPPPTVGALPRPHLVAEVEARSCGPSPLRPVASFHREGSPTPAEGVSSCPTTAAESCPWHFRGTTPATSAGNAAPAPADGRLVPRQRLRHPAPDAGLPGRMLRGPRRGPSRRERSLPRRSRHFCPVTATESGPRNRGAELPTSAGNSAPAPLLVATALRPGGGVGSCPVAAADSRPWRPRSRSAELRREPRVGAGRPSAPFPTPTSPDSARTHRLSGATPQGPAASLPARNILRPGGGSRSRSPSPRRSPR